MATTRIAPEGSGYAGYGYDFLIPEADRNRILDNAMDWTLTHPMQKNYVLGPPETDWNSYDNYENLKQRHFPNEYASTRQILGTTRGMYPAMTELMASAAGYEPGDYKGLAIPPIAYGDIGGVKNWTPNWAYLKSLEDFKEFGGGIGIMGLEDYYPHFKKNEITGDQERTDKPTSTGGFFRGMDFDDPYKGMGNIVLNPELVKSWPSAPNWQFEFYEGDDSPSSISNTSFDELGNVTDNWNLSMVLPHETYHFEEDMDKELGEDLPDPYAHIGGTFGTGSYGKFPRHPMMHMMDRSQHAWRSGKDLAMTQAQHRNFMADQAQSMQDTLNRGYFHEEDFDRSLQGFGGSGRSRIDDRGRPMQQSPRTITNAREQAIINRHPTSSPQANKRPFSHHFNTGGLASLML